MAKPIRYEMNAEEIAQYKTTGQLPFVQLESIGVNTAQTPEYYLANIRENLKNRYTLFEELPEFQKIKGSENPIALVGGGPSLKGQLDVLRKFDTVMACGSTHDFLVENDIIPRYLTMLDPDAICAKYVTKPNKKTEYLLASCCHPDVYRGLKDYDIVVWHADSDEFREETRKLQPDRGYMGIAGGCTVGMRSIGLSMLLGYNNIHFFGFDSCIRGNEIHAYELQDKEYEMLGFADIRPLKLAKGTKWEKDYRCVGYQIAQAVCFHEYFVTYGNAFTPTFHGGGLLSDMFDYITRKEDAQPVA